ncbi:MAG: hypothetical protein KA175_00790 [Flavobacteriales bacterium]|nr:hypothetical protein [Flavobacteriales bacterium]MBP6696119.1 hypothetical protein [Flavobacteriales bacterium]
MTLPRTLLISGLLMVAAGAVIHWRGPLEQKAREQWRAWRRPDAPPDARVQANAVRPSTDGATLETQDPPPYDRPSLLRSGMSIRIGGRAVRPNMHFDFEVTGDTTKISRAHARSGASAQVIRSGTEYAPAIRRRAADVADTLVAVAVGLWVFTKGEKPPITIVASVDRGDQQLAWFGKDIHPSEHEPGKWQHFQAEFLLRDVAVTGDDQVSIYLWNRDKQLLYVDDMDVVFRSKRVLGRAPGIPFDLEDRTRGTLPPPFAQVSFHSRTDPAALGVVAGRDAPPLASVDVVLTPGSSDRLHYTPGDGVAHLIGADGRERALVRGWCRELGQDLLGFERLIAKQGSTGVQLIGFDVDQDPATDRIIVAAAPPPVGAELIITMPQP